jgi:hypothetical protein
MEKDWQARFQFSESKPSPIWLIYLLVTCIPLGPWYVELLLALVIGVILCLKLRKRDKSGLAQ